AAAILTRPYQVPVSRRITRVWKHAVYTHGFGSEGGRAYFHRAFVVGNQHRDRDLVRINLLEHTGDGGAAGRRCSSRAIRNIPSVDEVLDAIGGADKVEPGNEFIQQLHVVVPLV